MSLINFIEQFPDETSCKQKFKEYRDHSGVTCSKYGGTDHYWEKDKEQYQWKWCKTRTTLKRGTEMHKSKLPFRYWFIVMHLLTATKKSFSAKEIQGQLGHKRYYPIWHMVHKLRQSMGKRVGEYILAGRIELDEGYFSTEVPSEEKDKPLKRGRGSQKKPKVLVMAESEVVESPQKRQKPGKVGYLKMKVIEGLASGAPEVDTGNSTPYVDLKDFASKYNEQVMAKDKMRGTLSWIHIATGNAKQQLVNIFHDIKPEFLQNHFDEFCCNFDRRYHIKAPFNSFLGANMNND